MRRIFVFSSIAAWGMVELLALQRSRYQNWRTRA